MSEKYLVGQGNKIFNLFSIFFFPLFVFFALRYQFLLLNYMEWGDESETVVTAKMLASGLVLFQDVFNHHGPLTFVPGLILEKFGSFGIPEHRLLIAGLQIIAFLAVYFTPLKISGANRRFCVTMFVSLILLYLPEIFGHMYKYQVLAGLILVITLSQYSLPSIIEPQSISKTKCFIGNLLLASLPFLAITYIPLAMLLFIASLQKRIVLQAVTFFFIGLIINIILLASIGSIKGFLAYHVYLNSSILPEFTGHVQIIPLITSIFQSLTRNLEQTILLLFLIFALYALSKFERNIPYRVILLGMGLVSILVRGNGFHELPYYYAILTLPIIFFHNASTSNLKPYVMLICMIGFTLKLSCIIPDEYSKFTDKHIPMQSEFSSLVKNLTFRDDKIIAYTFRNYEYILSERLPASGNFFYFPWQEKYNENPKLGIQINTCHEILTYKPKIMLIDKWNIWGKYSWDSYAKCLDKIIENRYYKIPDRPYYILKSFIENKDSYFSHLMTARLTPSSTLSSSNPLEFLLPQNEANKKIVQLGLRFATHGKALSDSATLQIKQHSGTITSINMQLGDINDNSYQYFTLNNTALSLKITTQATGGLSVWQSMDKKGILTPCIILKYIDGTIYVTPGCPIL